MSALKILVAGRNGQVGFELARSLLPLGDVAAPSRSEFDFNEPRTIERTVREIAPHIIVNAAAYTAVDAAESDPATAERVNGTAVGVLAEEARKIGSLVVHYSTDYVFDGKKPSPYVEADTTGPINVYGRSKLAGEELLRQSSAQHLILRTSWVYGARGRNFLRTILKLSRERESLRVVDDQQGAPTWARSIADATAHILHHNPAATFREIESGTVNLTSTGSTTWYGFAVAAISEWRALEREKGSSECKIVPIPTSEYPTPAARPRNSRLDGSELPRRFGVVMPDWQVAVKRCLEEIAS